MKTHRHNFLRQIKTLLFLGVFLAIGYTSWSQTIFSEINGFEPRFIPPGGEDGVKNIKTDYGAVGDGVTDDTEAFKAWAAGGERTLFIPEGTYLLSEQIRLGSGMKRVLWIGERRTTTIIKLKDSSPGFGNEVIPHSFIYFIAPGQQGEQNMQNHIQHLTIEIGTGNPGAVALNFHTNNTGGVYDVAIKASDPAGSKGLMGIGIYDWGAGPGFVRFTEIDGFNTGIQISTDNHWTLEHVKVENCNTGIRSEQSSSIRAFTAVNCGTGADISHPAVLTDAEITTTEAGANAVVVSHPDVMIRNLTTTGYNLAISTTLSGSDGDQTGPFVGHWLGEPVQSLWDPAPGMDESIGIPVEESPVYQYAQTEDEWALVSTAAEMQSAIDAGKTHIYLPRSTSLSSEVYLRNNLKHIMFLGQSAPYSNSPTYILQDGNVEAVVIEQNAGGIVSHQFPRTAVIRHAPTRYETEPAGYGGKVFMESVVASGTFNNVNAWIRDFNTEAGGPDAPTVEIINSTAWILGQKTEDFATKITVSDGGYCELLGGTYRQNWDQEDFDRAGLDINNRLPLFLIHEAHASFAAVHTWGPNITFDPVIREVRNGETRDLSRDAGGGAIALFVGYSSTPPALVPVEVAGITVSPQAKTIEVGQTELIVSTIQPITASDKSRSWTSSDETVAVVDGAGFVTAVGEGTAEITVATTSGNHSASTVITVPEFIAVEGISVSPDTGSINVGESLLLEVTFTPENATNKRLSWKSNNPSVATVTSDGTVTGLTPGTAEITISSEDGDFSVVSVISVVQPGSSGLYAYEGFEYAEGELVGLDGGVGWAGPWAGGGSILATSMTHPGIEVNGNHLGLENQTANREIAERLGGSGDIIWIGFMLHEGANSPSIQFNLLDGAEVKMSLLRGPYDQWGLNADGTGDPDNLPWSNDKTGSHFWLFKLVFGASGTNVTIWQDPDLSAEPDGGASVALPAFSFDNIQMSASFPGGNAVTLFDEIRIAGNFSNTRNNDAFVAVEGISVSPETLSLNAGETQQLTTSITPSNATDQAVFWSTEDAAVAEVDDQGLVSAVGNGSTIITALSRDGGFSAAVTVTVTVPVSGVNLNPDTADINAGENLQLTATVMPENASNKNISWSSDNTEVATVDQNGLVEGVAAGVANITVVTEDGDFSATTEITVNTAIGVPGYGKSNISVFPSPGDGNFKISFPSVLDYVQFHIYNMQGEEIYYREFLNFSEENIDISSQKEGVYIIKMNSGSAVYFSKVMLVK